MKRIRLFLLLPLFFISGAAQHPPDPAKHFNRAIELQQQGKLDEAAVEYRVLLELKPDYAEAHANLGVVLARLGRYKEAVAAYETAYRLAPQLTPILLNLGIAYYRAGQFAKAAEVFPKFLEKVPDSTQARRLHGMSLAALGRDEEAIAQLEQTLDAPPPDAAAFYQLGFSCLRASKPGLQAALKRLASFSEGLPALHFLQGQAFLRDKEYEQAIEELEAARKGNSDLPRLHYTLGLAYLQLNRNAEARAAFLEEERRTPRDYQTLYSLALIYEADTQLVEARRYVNAALGLDPQSIEANALLSKILMKQGRETEALAPLQRAVARDPKDPVKRYTLARLYRQLNRTADAKREFAEVQRLKAEQLEQDRKRTPKP
ncbi:MAG: tetratricopeptide repeat protein [Blastocatellia bacterium]